MNREYKDASTSTDPLSVQLYFDQNNVIRWNIITQLSESNENDNKINNYVNINQSNINQSNINQSNINLIEEVKVKNKKIILSNFFNNIYTINSKKNIYNFKYTNVNLYINDTNTNNNNVDYNTFDYIKYNSIVNGTFNKSNAWKDYIKKIKNGQEIQMNLSVNDLSYIDAFVTILDNAILNELDKIMIIIDDLVMNIENIENLSIILENFDIKNSRILITSYNDSIDNSNNLNTTYGLVNEVKMITSFVIIKDLYYSFKNKLLLKKSTWISCLQQLITESLISSFKLNKMLFY